MNYKDVLQNIKQIIRRYLHDKYRIFLFGSRATGTASNVSDYDIGIEGPNEVDLHILARIQEQVRDLDMFQNVDIVDFKSVDEDFYKIAIKKRQWIN